MLFQRTCFLLFFLISFSFTHAQKETYNWIFSFHQGLSFETNPPLSIPLGDNLDYLASLNPISISDSLGNLLFYSAQGRIFDSQHNEMPNGLTTGEAGGFSVTHPVFVIPRPNTPNHYYLFVNGATFNNHLKVIEVDMTLNGGLGGIAGGSIQTLHDNTDDKITAILHSNLQDIWVIHHELDSNNFNAWLVTPDGVSANPVTTPIGNIIEEYPLRRRGQIKASLDGKKVAVVYKDMSLLETFDFNRTTGEFSNHFAFENPDSAPMGLEFSPSGRFLFINEAITGFKTRIVQFDLEMGDSTSIAASAKEIAIAANFTTEIGCMQLAANGKIYISNRGQSHLAVINYPDLIGTSCNYIDEGPMAITEMGLPVFFHPLLQQPFFVQDGLCVSEPTSFNIHESFTYPIDSVIWNFGDPDSGIENISKMISPTHLFSEDGVFFVELTVFSDSITYNYHGTVVIVPLTLNPLDSIYQSCSNEILQLSTLTTKANYLWSDSSIQHSIEIHEPGEYWVKISIDECPSSFDTFIVEHLETPVVNLGDIRGICNWEPISLDATNPNCSYLWNTGDSIPTIEVDESNEYIVTVTNSYGCSEIDTVSVVDNFIFSFPSQQNILCYGDSIGIAIVFIEEGVAPFSYVWDTETIDSYRKDSLKIGQYSVTVTDASGCTTIQDFNITGPTSPIHSIVQTTVDMLQTETYEGIIQVETSGGSPPYNYSIDAQNFQSEPLFENLKYGTYNLIITDKNDCQEHQLITVDSILNEEKIELIKVFPNPTFTNLFIQFPEESNANIEFYNTIGQLILKRQFKGNVKEYQINSESLSSGIYFLKIQDNEFSKTWKVVVKKE